jgi:hypothetical protein
LGHGDARFAGTSPFQNESTQITFEGRSRTPSYENKERIEDEEIFVFAAGNWWIDDHRVWSGKL